MRERDREAEVCEAKNRFARSRSRAGAGRSGSKLYQPILRLDVAMYQRNTALHPLLLRRRLSASMHPFQRAAHLRIESPELRFRDLGSAHPGFVAVALEIAPVLFED